MNTVAENIAKTFKGKKLLFLENDNVLENGLETLLRLLDEKGIQYPFMFEIEDVPLPNILQAIKDHDGIIFMTQWVYETSRKLRDYMFTSKEKKDIIEVYIAEPTWYYKPKVVHDVYIFHGIESIFDDGPDKGLTFYKLRPKKAYWD
jgi:hypothetical protein